jgi:hypothetical protein
MRMSWILYGPPLIIIIIAGVDFVVSLYLNILVLIFQDSEGFVETNSHK